MLQLDPDPHTTPFKNEKWLKTKGILVFSNSLDKKGQ
jgi:hypothetical protein